MRQLEFKDFLIAGAFGSNVASIICYALNILIWASLISSTILLGLLLSMIIKEERK